MRKTATTYPKTHGILVWKHRWLLLLTLFGGLSSGTACAAAGAASPIDCPALWSASINVLLFVIA